MENLLLDLWVEEVKRQFCGYSLTGLESPAEGYLQLLFGLKLPRLHFYLRPQRIWYCFSRRLEPLSQESRNRPPAALLCPGKLLTVHRIPKERILQLSFKSSGGDLTLVAELIPPSPNLLVLDPAGTLLWMLNKDRIRGRGLDVGSTYRPPDRPQRLAMDVALQNPPGSGQPLDKWLQQNVEGMSPWLASELVHRSDGFIATLAEARDRLLHESPCPCIYTQVNLANPGLIHLEPWRQMLLSPWRLTSQPRERESVFPTANDALECFARVAAAYEEFQALRSRLLAPLALRLKRLQRASFEAIKDIQEMADAERYRTFAELLLCHLGELRHQGTANTKPVRVEQICAADHYADPGSFIRIPVDPDKSLQANAETYFKKYRKAQRGAKKAQERLAMIQRQLAQLQRKQEAILSAADLSTLRCHIEKAPAPPAKAKRSHAQATGSKRQRSCLSSDGFEILVGQSASNNEEITFHIAAPSDLWLHVADYTGSHVIILNPRRRPIPQATLLQAAALAAYYSAARKESKVEVRFTERKFVHKLKGAARGMVRLQRFQSLYVKPQRSTAAPAAS